MLAAEQPAGFGCGDLPGRYATSQPKLSSVLGEVHVNTSPRSQRMPRHFLAEAFFFATWLVNRPSGWFAVT